MDIDVLCMIKVGKEKEKGEGEGGSDSGVVWRGLGRGVK